ncbi:MAG: DUF1800 domain-containing protein [Verrucomicrobiota bacterium]
MLSRSQWSSQHAAHLISRAGFGGSPEDISQLSKLPMDQAVRRIVHYEDQPDYGKDPEWTRLDGSNLKQLKEIRKLPEKERREKFKELRRESRRNLASLKSWWLDRMLKSNRPLEEKMTLFWHGHFVSSSDKVKNALMLWQQNRLLREKSTGNFEDLTVAIGRDPAMLVYLDGSGSKKAAPNENYARELMELFTLGEGNYTEEDIKEAARAFTGWNVRRFQGKAKFNQRNFDSKEKSFFGQSGNYKDSDIVAIIFEQDRAAEYIAHKLWEFFAYKNPEQEIVSSLAETLRNNKYELKPVLEEMFTSKAFYSQKAMRTQIKSPIMWFASLSRLLDLSPIPSRASTQMLAQLGQDLFNPPSVKGWDGGRAWISTTTLIMRNNLAHLMVFGGNPNKLGIGAANRLKNIPQNILDDMSEEQKKRLEIVQKRSSKRNIPSLFKDFDLLDLWESESEANRLNLLSNTVYNSSLRAQSLAEIRSESEEFLRNPKAQGLKSTLYQMIAHPEFQLC